MMKSIYTAIVVLLLAGCAAERGPEALRPEITRDWINKSSLVSTDRGNRRLYTFKNTIVRASSNGGFGFVGLQSDLKLGYFDFSETNLQFKSIEGIYQGEESTNVVNRVIVQWPATHHDVRLDEREGRVTNQEIDDDFKRWDAKKYIQPDFNNPSIGEEQTLPYSPAFATTLGCWTLASRERLRNSFKLETDGYMSFVVEAVYKQNPLCAQSRSQHHDGDFTYTLHYRYSFRPYEPSGDYATFEFQKGELDPARQKYGYFQTVKPEADPSIPGGRKNRFFANRWNLNKTHYFYFAKGTPEKFKPLFQDIFKQTNELLAKTGNAIRFEVYDYNYNHETGKNDEASVRDFGDHRYSFINIVDELDPAAPLGYGPSDADPLTGEIIAANTIIWTGSLEYYMVRIKQIADAETDKFTTESIYQKMAQALEMDHTQWATNWDMLNSKMGKGYKGLVADTTFNVGYNPYAAHDTLIDVPGVVLTPSRKGENEDTEVAFIDSVTSLLSSQYVNSKLFTPETERRALSGNLSKSFLYADLLAEDDHLKEMMGFINQRQSGVNFAAFKKGIRDQVEHRHLENEVNKAGHCIFPVEDALAGAGKLFLDGATKEQIIESVVYRVGIHEFGHNLNLRHNFYGTVDNSNFRLHEHPETRQYLEKVNVAEVDVTKLRPKETIEVDGTLYWAQNSSSVMDYLRLEHEAHTPRTWEDYDRAAIFFAYSGGKELHPERDYLFCTDEHTTTSALCNRFDMGSTPSEVLMSIIEGYEQSYAITNYRNGRAFWNTAGYPGRIFGTMWSVKEFYAMWRSSFVQDIVKNSLSKRGVTDNNDFKEFYSNLSSEMKKTVMLSMAFYQSVIQQSAVDKPFRSVKHEKTGALERLGIGIDKQFAMYFLAGDDSFPYHPNRYMIHQSYLSHTYDAEMAGFMKKIWENVVTQRVDMEPWFISFGRGLYARSAMNFYNRSTVDYVRNIRPEYYARLADLIDETGVKLNPDYNAQEVEIGKAPAGSVFTKGEKVVVVNFDGGYYVVSKAANPYAYTVANTVIRNMENGSSTVQDKIDLQELLNLSR